MNAPLPVTVVRPKAAFIPGLITAAILALIDGWVVMLLAPPAVHMHPSYWHSVGFYLLTRTLVADRSYLSWSKPQESRKRGQS